jgi:hypothetical protein
VESITNSRRGFLKSTIAGASVALGELHRHAAASELPAATNAPYTQGIGIYPGDPREDFSPSIVPADASNYRNLALLRPAYHSSSYDYNLTAQLVTDGIKDTRLPSWVETSEDVRGILPKNEREFFLDHNPTSSVDAGGRQPWVQLRFGGANPPEIDRIEVLALAMAPVNRETVNFTVSVSSDDRQWEKVGSVTGPELAPLSGLPRGFAQPDRLFHASIPLTALSRSSFYRIEFSAGGAAASFFDTPWQVAEVAFFKENRRVEAGGPYSFTSAWMSAGSGEEWVYVDLGAPCDFDRIVLSWIARAAEGSLQVSDDARNWRDIQALPNNTGSTDDIKLIQSARGRYVRVLMCRPTSPYGYILSEIEIYGRGGFVSQAKAAPVVQPNGRLELSGGEWRLQRDSLVAADGAKLSKPGYRTEDWVLATVPGTVLSSYINVGAIADPNYGDNQLAISDSFFYADFWYRNEFAAPPATDGDLVWLNFDGINWKAEVFLNGDKLGGINGGFMRARFDVTKLLLRGGRNAIAVRVIKNATPGSAKQKTFENPGKNGGSLGLDNPTYHASIGWDWIPTIRGRNLGIWGSVYLTKSGPVTLEDPFVSTALQLPDVSKAEVTVQADLVNHQTKPITGTLRGRLGDARFEQRVTIAGSSRKTVKFDPSAYATLRFDNPKLWWPAGYGEPHLYDCELSFDISGGRTSDVKTFQAGLRQMTYSEEGAALKIYVNGRRLVPKGGNWGFSESMLRYRAREFDSAVRYHRDMNFTMIRNWVAQTGQDELFEACDRHGIVIWQDFWLANPWDGPEPEDNELFMSNARDFILRIRNHASIGLYCGRNEGMPPEPLETGLRKLLDELHPGLHYISDSAHGVVSGEGPYRAMPLDFYFKQGSAEKLHSEMGMPNIPTIDSVRAMMTEASLWPQELTWGLHDFCLAGAQGGDSFRRTIDFGYGGATNAEEWVSLAQFLNYEGYRAMFEGQSKHRAGLLLWMSHPCWPSFVWQTYDYFLEPTAAYFGCKKACEPLHIQWNRATDSVEVVNHCAGNVKGLTATVEIFNMDGAKKWEKTAPVDSNEDSALSCIRMNYPSGLTPVHFLRLRLTRGGDTVSTNFYLRGLDERDFRAIRQLPTVRLEAETRIEQQGSRWFLKTELHNASSAPALMVRLKAVREKTGDRILPVLYSDNYVSLLPGERQTVSTELRDADTRGEKPRIVISGFNVTGQ